MKNASVATTPRKVPVAANTGKVPVAANTGKVPVAAICFPSFGKGGVGGVCQKMGSSQALEHLPHRLAVISGGPSSQGTGRADGAL